MAVLVLLWLPTAGSAASFGSPAAIRALADRAAAAALERIDDQGRPLDPASGRPVDDYGPVAVGYAGLRAAARSGDRQLLARAIAAVLVSVHHRHALPFDHWLVGKALAWGQRHLADDPLWDAAVPALAAYVVDPPHESTERPPPKTSNDLRHYSNWRLVELAATAAAAGVGTQMRGWRLTRPPAIASLAVRSAGPPITSSWSSGNARALSDPKSNPLAYSAFSAALLHDARRSAPQLVPSALRRRASELGRYLAAVAAPNGAVAWSGRSDHQSWTLAAAMVAGIASGDQAGRGLAAGAWRRLRLDYGFRKDGQLAITPVLARTDDRTGLDSYADRVIYGGLTMVLLNDAADALDGRPPLTGRTPSATRPGTVEDRGGAGIVAQRRGGVWWAASVRPSHHDLRYQPGLQAVQILHRGRWVDVLPARPRGDTARPLWPLPAGCRPRLVAATRLRCPGTTLDIAVDRATRRVLLQIHTRPGRRITGGIVAPYPEPTGERSVKWIGGTLRTSTPLRTRLYFNVVSSSTTIEQQRLDYTVTADRLGRATISIGR